jgi:phage terminase large subunit-like protein
VKAACKRQRDDLKRKSWAYHFDEEVANRPCNFAHKLPHIKGKDFAGKKIEFEDWQCFIVTTVYGWVDAVGNRRFKIAYIEVPRKNGKSTMSAPIGLYALAADKEPGAEVYSAATTREQARIVWADAKAMVDKCKPLREALCVATSSHSIFKANNSSKFQALSRDQQGNLDGLNIHLAIIDELHAHKTRDVWDVIETATGARTQPLIWAITTAGSNRAGICYEQRSYVIKILSKVHSDDTYFGIIYTIDKGDDPFDPVSWAKANPNYGVSVKPDDLQRKAVKARQMASALNNFLTKHLNVWVNADSPWMNMTAWDECAEPAMREEDFASEECMVSCDLATKTDIAPKLKIFRRIKEEVQKDGTSKPVPHYYVFGSFYLPETAIEDGRNSQYEGWELDGLLIKTPGSVTDFGLIEDDIKADAAKYRVLNAGFDPWQASYLIQRLQVENLPVLEYRQTVQNMSQPMKEVEALVLSKHLHHNGDPVLAWMISNVVCHIDVKENIYPRKEKPENKIDGAVALIMGIGMWLQPQAEVKEYQMMFLR